MINTTIPMGGVTVTATPLGKGFGLLSPDLQMRYKHLKNPAWKQWKAQNQAQAIFTKARLLQKQIVQTRMMLGRVPMGTQKVLLVKRLKDLFQQLLAEEDIIYQGYFLAQKDRLKMPNETTAVYIHGHLAETDAEADDEEEAWEESTEEEFEPDEEDETEEPAEGEEMPEFLALGAEFSVPEVLKPKKNWILYAAMIGTAALITGAVVWHFAGPSVKKGINVVKVAHKWQTAPARAIRAVRKKEKALITGSKPYKFLKKKGYAI